MSYEYQNDKRLTAKFDSANNTTSPAKGKKTIQRMGGSYQAAEDARKAARGAAGLLIRSRSSLPGLK